MHMLSRTARTAFTIVALSLPLSSAASQVTVFTTMLSGGNELPANPSLGAGSAVVTLDETLRTMRVQIEFFGLTGTTTNAHIHCCVAPPMNVGVATTTPTFPLFPTGVTIGSYDRTFDMMLVESYNPTFLAGSGGLPINAFVSLSEGMRLGLSYVNVHTNVYPGGEIRGFLTSASVSEPRAFVLLIAGLGMLIALTWGRRWGYSERSASRAAGSTAL